MKQYTKKETVNMTGLDSRRLSELVAKGAIQPVVISPGSGVSSKFDVVNIFEINICQRLFGMGLTFQTVKRIMSQLYEQEAVRRWITNYREVARDYMRKLEGADFDENYEPEQHDTAGPGDFIMPESVKGPKGVLIFYLGSDQPARIIPQAMEEVTEAGILPDMLTEGMVVLDLFTILCRVRSNSYSAITV